MKRHKLITWSNFTTAMFGVFIVVLLVSPNAKAIVIEGLMKIGLFQPPSANTIAAADSHGAPNIDLTLKSSDGKTFNLKDQKGKVIFINFWATWCPPCIAEMPSINMLYGQFNNNPDILILPIDVDGDLGKSTLFMKKNRYSLPVYNVVGRVPEGMVGQTIPTTIIIDKTGKIVMRHEGAADYSNMKFVDYLNQLSKK